MSTVVVVPENKKERVQEYDLFVGQCPKCGKSFDKSIEGKDQNEIKTLLFGYPRCRKFSPGDLVPVRVKTHTEIGECPHCHTLIYANFIHVPVDENALRLWHQGREANLRDRTWMTRNPMPTDLNILADYSDA